MNISHITINKTCSSRLLKFLNRCRGSDSNARTSTGIDLESIAVDLAWLPLHKKSLNNLIIIKSLGFLDILLEN